MEIEIRNRNNINSSNQSGESTIIISIADSDDDRPEIENFDGLQCILELSFHDITPKMNLPRKYRSMSDKQAREVAEFIKKYKNVDKLIVQCDAGISRSAGLAAGVLASITGDGNKILKDSRYIPNIWVYYQTLRMCLKELCDLVDDYNENYSFKVGDKVYWNDPDDGYCDDCSGEYFVKSINFTIANNKGTETDVQADELTRI